MSGEETAWKDNVFIFEEILNDVSKCKFCFIVNGIVKYSNWLN